MAFLFFRAWSKAFKVILNKEMRKEDKKRKDTVICKVNENAKSQRNMQVTIRSSTMKRSTDSKVDDFPNNPANCAHFPLMSGCRS